MTFRNKKTTVKVVSFFKDTIFLNPNLPGMLLIVIIIHIISCITYAKGTTLKANHNSHSARMQRSIVVLPMLKVRL